MLLTAGPLRHTARADGSVLAECAEAAKEDVDEAVKAGLEGI